MEEPYSIAKLATSSLSCSKSMYAAPSPTNKHELAVAIAGMGINIYNLRSNGLIASYSLSPTTIFQCAPVTVTIGMGRRTWVACQSGGDVSTLRVQQWSEIPVANGSSATATDSTETTLFELSAVCPRDASVVGIHYLMHSLLVVFSDGSCMALDQELTQRLWHVDSQELTSGLSAKYLSHQIMSVEESWLKNAYARGHLVHLSFFSIRGQEKDSERVEKATMHIVTILVPSRPASEDGDQNHDVEMYDETEASQHFKIEHPSRVMSRSLTLEQIKTVESPITAISTNGVLALWSTTPKDHHFSLYNLLNNQAADTNIEGCAEPWNPRDDGHVLQNRTLHYLNESTVLLSSATRLTLYELNFNTLQSSMTLSGEKDYQILSLLPQSKTSAHVVIHSPSLNSIQAVPISYSPNATLLSAIGKGRQEKKFHKDSSRREKKASKEEGKLKRESQTSARSGDWLEVVDIQDTWKSSLDSLSSDAREVLWSLESLVAGGAEQEAVEWGMFDDLMEDFLFGRVKLRKAELLEEGKDVHGRKLSKKKLAKALAVQSEAQSVNQLISTAEDNLVDSTESKSTELSGLHDSGRVPTLTEKRGAKQGFKGKGEGNVQATEISSTFVEQLIGIIFLPLSKTSVNPLRLSNYPQETVQYLLRKGLFSMSAVDALSATLFSDLVKNFPDLRLKIASMASGILPSHLSCILSSFLREENYQELADALSIILEKMEHFEGNVVREAIKTYLTSDDLEVLLKFLSLELAVRIMDDPAPSNTAKIQVSDLVLCENITNLLDTVGISTLMFSASARELIEPLRTSVAVLLAQTEQMQILSSILAEFCLKVSMTESDIPSKKGVPAWKVARDAKHGSPHAYEENPQPVEKKAQTLSLGAIKNKLNVGDAKSERSKKHEKHLGTGRYTIDTLQL